MELPNQVLFPVLSAVIVYWMIGYQNTAENFGWWVAHEQAVWAAASPCPAEIPGAGGVDKSHSRTAACVRTSIKRRSQPPSPSPPTRTPAGALSCLCCATPLPAPPPPRFVLILVLMDNCGSALGIYVSCLFSDVAGG